MQRNLRQDQIHQLFNRLEKEIQMDEELENLLELEKSIQQAGYVNLRHFEETRYHTYMGLLRFGGSFAKALGEALSHADHNNSKKIMRYWNDLCEQHALIHKMAAAKEKANDTTN
jgi:hypothetical protein